MASELKPWKYEIKYGPEGEDAYSWVYDDHGAMVATMKTHKAKQIVDTMNTRPAPAATETGLETVDTQMRYRTIGKEIGDWSDWRDSVSPPLDPVRYDVETRELCLRSQAEELLAAERANTEIALEQRNMTIAELARLEADNAAKDARIEELIGTNIAVARRQEELANQLAETKGLLKTADDLAWQRGAAIEALEAKLAAANEVAQLVIQAEEDKSGDPNFYILMMQTAYDKARAVWRGKPS